MPVEVEYAACTHIGAVREENQDCLFIASWVGQARKTATSGQLVVEDSPFTCAVLDGMGGYTGGALASRTAAHALTDGLVDLGLDLSPEAFTLWFTMASEAVKDLAGVLPQHERMGTTAAAVSVAPGGVTVANVGDCRVYRLWEGFFSLVSIDDRIRDPRRPGGTLVSQAMGGLQRDPIVPHFVRFPVGGAATLLLCSDGLYDVVCDAQLEEVLSEAIDLPGRTQGLVSAALANGGPDNISAIVLQIRDSDAAARSPLVGE